MLIDNCTKFDYAGSKTSQRIIENTVKALRFVIAIEIHFRLV
jgi:hypothetical protein